MARPLPPLDLLVGFESAARQCSFSKAGEEIFVTQSAVSRQVKKLEEFLGLALFERRHRALELTEQGRVLYEVVGDSLGRLSDIVEILRKETTYRRLKVSTTTSFASLWLVPRLAQFQAFCPEVSLHIDADNRLVDLKQGMVDMAIRYCTPDAVSAESAILLSGEEVFPVCSPALLRRDGRKLASIDDLRHHTLLHLNDPQNAWPWLQWQRHRFSLQPLRPDHPGGSHGAWRRIGKRALGEFFPGERHLGGAAERKVGQPTIFLCMPWSQA
jgi:DNA-binding transcriptional LysR family regulator